MVIFITLHAVSKGNVTKLGKLSIGMNYYSNNVNQSIHAERSAIDNLPSQKKISNINILVIRFSKTGKICMSKPCCNCINFMSTYPSKKGYNIKKIYYSDENGNIVKTNLYKLKNQN